MKTLLIIILVFLLASVGLNVWQWRSAYEQEENMLAQNEQFQRDILKHEVLAKTARDSAHELRARRSADSLKYIVELTHRQIENNAMSKRLKSLRPTVQPIIDSVPPLKEFIALQDSILVQKDSIISTITARTNDIEKSFNLEIEQLNTQLQATNQTSELWQKSAENSMQLYEKLKRKKFSVGPEISYGVNKDGLSPSVGVSIQYSLWRF